MWKEEIKQIVVFTLDNSWDENQFLSLICENIIEKNYKFYFLAEKSNMDYYSYLNNILSSSKIEWEFYEIPENKIDFYDSIDFGIHVSSDFDLLSEKADWNLIIAQDNLYKYNKNDRTKHETIENCYLVRNLNDVKDILIFFAVNGMEC